MAKEYIASISYGKDSMAMLEVIKQKDMPLDRIITVDAMATETIPVDMPSVIEFKDKADNIIKSRYGIEVEHINTGVTFEQIFYSIPKDRTRTKEQKEKGSGFEGYIKGWPMYKGSWCSKAMKVRFTRLMFNDDDHVQYIGIADNEDDRKGQLNERLKAPLVEHGITEEEAMRICEQIDLVAPEYKTSTRSGCFFCPFQPVEQLRKVRKEHGDLWDLMLKWDDDSPVPWAFHRNPVTLHDMDKRFALEERGLLGPKWTWIGLGCAKNTAEFKEKYISKMKNKQGAGAP